MRTCKFHEILWEERNEGREEGREKGREEGRTLTLIEQVCRKIRTNKSNHEIAAALDEDEAQIRKISSVAESFAPEYDAEKILNEIKSAE